MHQQLTLGIDKPFIISSFISESSLSHCTEKDSMSHVCHCVLGTVNKYHTIIVLYL